MLQMVKGSLSTIRFVNAKHIDLQIERLETGQFGYCPRALCPPETPMLPVGLADLHGRSTVKLFCCVCQDVYNPSSSRFLTTDGVGFGTSFPHLVAKCFPEVLQNYQDTSSGERSMPELYVPKIFGFRVHDPNAAKMLRQRACEASANSSTAPP